MRAGLVAPALALLLAGQLAVLDRGGEAGPDPAAEWAVPAWPSPEPAPERSFPTASYVSPAPAPVPSPSRRASRSRPAAASGADWDGLARCESGGDWSINTGNGFYGGIQFELRTWREFGGTGMPHLASRERQIEVGERVLAVQGRGAWPGCTAKGAW